MEIISEEFHDACHELQTQECLTSTFEEFAKFMPLLRKSDIRANADLNLHHDFSLIETELTKFATTRDGFYSKPFWSNDDDDDDDDDDNNADMLEEISDACDEFRYEKCKTSIFDKATKLVPLMLKLVVNGSADPYLHHDSSLTGTASAGFVITSKGFYAKTSFGKIVHTKFYELADAEIRTNFTEDKVYADDKLIACFTWGDDDEKWDCYRCVKLIKKIRSIVLEYY